MTDSNIKEVVIGVLLICNFALCTIIFWPKPQTTHNYRTFVIWMPKGSQDSAFTWMDGAFTKKQAEEKHIPIVPGYEITQTFIIDGYVVSYDPQ